MQDNHDQSHDHDHDQSHDHDHDHNHGGGVEHATGDSLYPFIDTSKLWVLNALDPRAASHPFKPFHERQNHSCFLASNYDDPELILFIPFTEAVSIKSICISGSAGDGNHPKAIKMFTNRSDMDFSNVNELQAQQKLELIEDDTGNLYYPLQMRKFQGVSSLTLFVESNYGGDKTKIYYIGIKGESKQWRHGIVECVYEARPQPADHKIKDINGSTSLF
ncbi:hypothetical protein CCR75_008456 [Bremia lactucae]|uniref:PITH domain-containing protein n=1 Tax=Bremia lactucae TaxID=4779 RepID=A0A976NZU7_BRELC|nr:hypothetical protein CCR75_008456 [Bremia lactucae]